MCTTTRDCGIISVSGGCPSPLTEKMMLDITYYYVEQLVRPETGWARQMPRGYENYNNGFQDKAQAEKFLQEEKAHWENFLANQEQTDDIKRLQAVNDWRIVEDTVTFTHVSEYMYSDIKAYEIVRVVSDKTLEVRQMKTQHSCANLEFTPGGFSGHYHNQRDQEVTYEPNPEAEVIRIRRKQGSFEKWGLGRARFGLTTAPHAFHDFNF